METFISFCGFGGAWLLVLGPIFQASLELQDENAHRDQISRIRQAKPAESTVSAWWWLVPPVKLTLERRAAGKEQQRAFAALPNSDIIEMVSYRNKADGWVLVSGGGFLLALKETHELVVHMQWHTLWFWLIVFAATFVSLGYTILRISTTRTLITKLTTIEPDKAA